MIELLVNDKDIIVCVKPVGLLSEQGNLKDKNMPDALKKQTGCYRVDTLHRLDKAVGGVMVYSKSRLASAALSKAIASHKMLKEYLAVVHGQPQPANGIMEDILFKDSSKNRSYVVKTERKGTKFASLEYETVASAKTESGVVSLVKIRLHTGRTHQIRVQFSSRKMPLMGDGKYGGNDKCDIALWSYHLAFAHPKTGKPVDVKRLPQTGKFPWNVFKEDTYKDLL